MERMENVSVDRESRDEVAQESLVMVEDYLVTGTGAGTYYSSYPQYRSSDVSGFYDHAHNDYVEFLATFGALGTLPLAASVLLAMTVAVRVLLKRRDRLARGAAFAVTMGVVSLLIHSAVDFNLHIPSNALLFVVVLAMAQLSKVLKRTTAR